MLLPGHTWLVISALLGTWGGISAGFLPAEHFGAMAGLGWLQGAIIFHRQLLLADHRIRQHNVLQMLQGGLLLAGLLVAFFGMSLESVEAFIGALAMSLCITTALSILWVAYLPSVKNVTAPAEVVRRLWKFGRSQCQTVPGELLKSPRN